MVRLQSSTRMPGLLGHEYLKVSRPADSEAPVKTPIPPGAESRDKFENAISGMDSPVEIFNRKLILDRDGQDLLYCFPDALGAA